MTVGESLDITRARYLESFAASLRTTNYPDARVVTEAVLRDNTGALVLEGELALPVRVDFIVLSGAHPLERKQIHTSQIFVFEPLAFDWEGELEVWLGSFRWEACQIRIAGHHSGTQWEPLIRWFTRWFDCTDTKPVLSNGLHGVVHFLSDPIREGSRATFNVDFGSAPVEAFEELLDAVKELNAKRVQIGRVNDD